MRVGGFWREIFAKIAKIAKIEIFEENFAKISKKFSPLRALFWRKAERAERASPYDIRKTRLAKIALFLKKCDQRAVGTKSPFLPLFWRQKAPKRECAPRNSEATAIAKKERANEVSEALSPTQLSFCCASEASESAKRARGGGFWQRAKRDKRRAAKAIRAKREFARSARSARSDPATVGTKTPTHKCTP